VARQSLVEVVRTELLHDLAGGKLVLGDKLPNEDDLAARFEVSRATIRDAVRGLVDSGYLSRVHGSGTFVTGIPRGEHALETSLSYTKMIEAAGAQPGIKVLGVTVTEPEEAVAERLAMGAGAEVLRVERVRTADGRPVVYSVDQIPWELVSDVGIHAVEPSLHTMLADHGCEVRSATARLVPVVASARLAKMLDVARGTPLQHFDQTDFDGSGRAVMVSREWHTSDLFELRVNRRA
jgi:DNA-binding GntR family transcriptional regulator